MTMSLVQTVTVGAGGAANITFSTVPQDATDLVIKVTGRATVSSYQGIWLRFNNDSASNYSWRRLRGTGSAASSGSTTDTGIELWALIANTATANTFSNIEAYIPNYTSSVAKSVSSDQVTEDNATLAYQQLVAGNWTGTAAISSIQLVPYGGNFAEFSSASLYKIKKA